MSSFQFSLGNSAAINFFLPHPLCPSTFRIFHLFLLSRQMLCPCYILDTMLGSEDKKKSGGGIYNSLGNADIKILTTPWLMWHSGLRTGLGPTRLPVHVLVRAHAWVSGPWEVGPRLGYVQDATSQCFSPSFSPFLSPLSIHK